MGGKSGRRLPRARGCCFPICYVDVCAQDPCAGQGVCQHVGGATGAPVSTCVLIHVCACTWFQFHRPCGTCRALPFHKRMEDLLCVRPEGLVKRCGGQLPPEGTRVTEDSHTVFLAGPALSRALALKARCHCLHLPVEAPEVHSPEKDSRAGGRLRPEAPMPVPDSRSWVPDATGPPETPTSKGNLAQGRATQNPPQHPPFPLLATAPSGAIP